MSANHPPSGTYAVDNIISKPPFIILGNVALLLKGQNFSLKNFARSLVLLEVKSLLKIDAFIAE
jgi:hypothetical protein